jgi:hypothetical protein
MSYEFTGMEDKLALAPEQRVRLEGAVLALVAEFVGAVTGLRPPIESAVFPPEMRPALDRLCDGLIQVVHECS